MTHESNQPEDASREPSPAQGAAGQGTSDGSRNASDPSAAPPEGAGSASDVAALQRELERAREEAQHNHERYLREAAELQNLRKRSVEREDKARRFAVERFASDMLNVKDSLEMGLAAAAGEPTVESLKEGMEATLRQLEQAFANAGLAEVDPEGEDFDPRHHEAMAMQELADLDREKVLTVIQKGYLLHERVLRPARVMVGKPAPRQPAQPGSPDPNEPDAGAPG